MTKTFEIGKCYKYKERKSIYFLPIFNEKDYGAPYNIFVGTLYRANQGTSCTSSYCRSERVDWEECIIKDLHIGDKVLLRNGDIEYVEKTKVYDCYMPTALLSNNKEVYKDTGKKRALLDNKHDVIAIIERAKDRIKDLDVGTYKLPNGDIIEVKE